MTTIAKSTYQNYQPAGVETGHFPLVEGKRVLEVGFGSGQLLKALRDKGNEVYGTDVGRDIVDKARSEGFQNVSLLDVSEENLPFVDDFFDAVYCFEVFEHLTNPYRMVSEVRRVLKADGSFYFSVPTQEGTMGYAIGRHAFVYPGLLERENLERFFMQMYFKVEEYFEDEPKIIHHRYYHFKNRKQPELPDIMEVIVGDYHVQDLYGHILEPDQLHEETLRELKPYLKGLDRCLAGGHIKEAQHLQDFLMSLYKGFAPFYFGWFEVLEKHGLHKIASNVLVKAEEDLTLSAEQKVELGNLMKCLPSKNPIPVSLP